MNEKIQRSESLLRVLLENNLFSNHFSPDNMSGGVSEYDSIWCSFQKLVRTFIFTVFFCVKTISSVVFVNMSDDEDFLGGQDYDEDDDEGGFSGGGTGGGSRDWSRLMKMMDDDKKSNSSDDEILSNWITKSEEQVNQESDTPPPISQITVPPSTAQPVPVKPTAPPPQQTAVAVERKKPTRKRITSELPVVVKTSEQLAEEELQLKQLQIEMGGDSDDDMDESSDEEESWKGQESNQNIKIRKLTNSSDVSNPLTVSGILPPQPTTPVSIPSPRSAFTGSPKSLKESSDVAKPIQRPTPTDIDSPPRCTNPTPSLSSSIPLPVHRPTVEQPDEIMSSPSTTKIIKKEEREVNINTQANSAPVPVCRREVKPETIISNQEANSAPEPNDANNAQQNSAQAMSLATMLFPDVDDAADVKNEVQNNRTTWIHSMLNYNSNEETSINDKWEKLHRDNDCEMKLPTPTKSQLLEENSILEMLERDDEKLFPTCIEDSVRKTTAHAKNRRGSATHRQYLDSVVNNALDIRIPVWLKSNAISRKFEGIPKLEVVTEKGQQRLSQLYTRNASVDENIFWKDSKKKPSRPPSEKTFIIGLSVYSQMTGDLIRIHEVYNCNKLSLLNDILKCDLSSHLSEINKKDNKLYLPDEHASMMILANGVFYLKKNSNSIDLLASVKDWIPKENKHNPWSFCDERDIDEMSFGDLMLDIGGLLLFRHNGRCDHFLRIHHLTNSSKDNLLPRTIFSTVSSRYPQCYICDMPASFICSYCPQLPSHSLICLNCKQQLTDIKSIPIGKAAES